MDKGYTVRVMDHTTDEDLIEWLDENDWPDLVVSEYDAETGLVWSEDCPFAISYDDLIVLH